MLEFFSRGSNSITTKCSRKLATGQIQIGTEYTASGRSSELRAKQSDETEADYGDRFAQLWGSEAQAMQCYRADCGERSLFEADGMNA